MTLTDAERERLRSNAAAMLAFADGKGAGYRIRGTDGLWMKVEQGHTWGIQLYEYRATPWTLPPPPDGRSWHRTDFTESMLPPVTDGGLPWRPLLLGEVSKKKVDRVHFADGTSNEVWGLAGIEASERSQRFTTRRPLPPLPSAPVVRDWTPEEMIGKTVKHKTSGGVYLITGVHDESCELGRTTYPIKSLRTWFTQLDGSPCGQTTA